MSVYVRASGLGGSVYVRASGLGGSVYVRASGLGGSVCVRASGLGGSVCVRASGLGGSVIYNTNRLAIKQLSCLLYYIQVMPYLSSWSDLVNKVAMHCSGAVLKVTFAFFSMFVCPRKSSLPYSFVLVEQQGCNCLVGLAIHSIALGEVSDSQRHLQ